MYQISLIRGIGNCHYGKSYAQANKEFYEDHNHGEAISSTLEED